MKKLCLIVFMFSRLLCTGQKATLFKAIEFDSSYQVIGLVQGHGKPVDSLERFWFLIDDPTEMKRLQHEWVFKDAVARLQIEQTDVEIFVIKEKRPIANYALIYPKQGFINVQNAWFRFDTSWLVKLHAAHPLQYRSEKMSFETYSQYAAYGNSLLNDSNLLFFFEPSLQFEGKFSVFAGRTPDPADPMFVLRDITKEWRALAPAGSFKVSYPNDDSFNLSRRDSVKIVVECSKILYDKYQEKGRAKGPWEPAKIEITTFWRKEPDGKVN
jgi:hypothetical protein